MLAGFWAVSVPVREGRVANPARLEWVLSMDLKV